MSHGTEIAFVYGAPPNATASAIGLSEAMIDYWVSFATSLNPNDGKGIPRKNNLIQRICMHFVLIQNYPVLSSSLRTYVGAVYSSESSEIGFPLIVYVI